MRLFTAIELTEGVRARWANPANAHLTVHFLGERPEAEVPALVAALEGACAGVAPVELAVGGLGKFRSGVLWLDVAGDLGPLERACRVELGLKDERYRPHITLARGFKGAMPTDDVEASRQNMTVSALTLFRSELGPSGAVHYVLARFPLIQPS
jgi:2'-5' RNA ligase